MTNRALFLGSIGVLAESSDMQRRAYNMAFQDVGLDWSWQGAAYYDMLRAPGGMARVEDYAARQGVRVDASAIHDAKQANFHKLAVAEGLVLRPGVAELVTAAQEEGWTLGLVTTTWPPTLDAVFDGLGGALRREAFSIVIDRTLSGAGKPDPRCYELALDQAGLGPEAAIAIEDTPESVASARGAGVPTIAFPGVAAIDRDFPGDVLVVDALSPALLSGPATSLAAE